jgi:hypothetical protein
MPNNFNTRTDVDEKGGNALWLSENNYLERALNLFVIAISLIKVESQI